MDIFKLAESIFADGRIENSDDWSELELELKHELDMQETPKEQQEEELQKVKEAWY